MTDRVIKMEEVQKHTSKQDGWIVIEDKVYDITKWISKHPGGVVLLSVLGSDATDVMHAMHPKGQKSKEMVSKYMKAYCIGSLDPSTKIKPHVAKFRQLREQFEKEGLFEANRFWWVIRIAEILLWYTLAWLVLELWSDPFETSRIRFWIVAFLIAVGQIQAGWTQHDFGHMAVFSTQFLNQVGHQFVIGFLKGASSQWWKSRHNRHHSKPNEIGQDPDIQNEPLFYFNELSAKIHKDKDPSKKWITSYIIPYQWYYWWFIGPPIVTTFLLPFQMFLYMQRSSRRTLALFDLFFMFIHHYTFAMIVGNYYSFWNGVMLYYAMRFIESHWFTWVTSMSHLPMPFHHANQDDFIELQFEGTQNLSMDFFTTWFSGHLNYQIEHHLFPNMPRHNYPKIQKRIQEFANEFKLDYIVKSMPRACKDIMDRLSYTANWWEK